MILYISGIEGPKYEFGIWKKTMGQLKVFKKAFHFAALTFYHNQVAYLWADDRVIDTHVAIHRWDFLESVKKWISTYKVEKVYIRYFWSDHAFIKLLRFLHDRRIKTIMEIPTFPYDNELRYGAKKVEDVFYRREIHKYLDKIITYAGQDKIWGVDCIPLANGIDFSSIVPVPLKKSHSELKLISVSLMFPWHGYERLIRGLYDYYSEKPRKKISVVFVGTGPEENKYRLLTIKLGLQHHISFLGVKRGPELEEIYSQADIGIGSLGFYKGHGETGSTLKLAEYCAHGLPVVCGYQDNRFSEALPFVLQVPNDDSSINIQGIIDFYDKLAIDGKFSSNIQGFAKENLSWDHVLQPVIEYLNDG